MLICLPRESSHNPHSSHKATAHPGECHTWDYWASPWSASEKKQGVCIRVTSDPSLPGTVLVLALNASWESPGPSETGRVGHHMSSLRWLDNFLEQQLWVTSVWRTHTYTHHTHTHTVTGRRQETACFPPVTLTLTKIGLSDWGQVYDHRWSPEEPTAWAFFLNWGILGKKEGRA